MKKKKNCWDVHDGCYENCTSTKQNCDLSIEKLIIFGLNYLKYF